MDWEENTNWKQLPEPAVGDIVLLKVIDSFDYSVKTIVDAVDVHKITATVEALFDWHTKEQLTGGDKISLVNKEVSFEPKFMWNVIKKHDTQ